MRYRKLTVEMYDFPKRLNRIIKVREDVDLFTLGTILVTVLGGTFEHCFLFETKTRDYVPESFEDLFEEKSEVYMTDYHLGDLGNRFKLIYDTGEGWTFNIKVSTRIYDIKSRKFAFLVSGVGQGIWEDNISTLWAYLDGKFGPETSTFDSDGYALPWNHAINCLGDFDKPLDIDEINQSLHDDILYSLDQLEENGVF
jgi:hypothetical protein